MTIALFAMATVAMADTATTVSVTKFHQSYPYSGKATVEYMVGGSLPANAIAEITIKTDNASATFTQNNVVVGANTNVIDFASSFGGALLLANASFTVAINPGVQLWEDGPYWAICNVGASEPEEYGYYFWWGDTVGYRRENGAWVAADGSSSDFRFVDGNTPTIGKDDSALRSEGWIDSSGNLAPAHDAATAHFGAPWRMPTNAELSALVGNCTTTWTTRNGVTGRLVTGTGAYAGRSIFLPATGYGNDSSLRYSSEGYYWSSTPNRDVVNFAWSLCVYSSGTTDQYSNWRTYGLPVRPVCDLSGCSATGAVTFDHVAVTEFHQSHPYSGRATVEYMVGGTLLPSASAEITITTDDASATFVQSNVVAGANTNVIDFAASFGGSLVLTNASFTVTINPGGVRQLWENGPYWAECNVGASEPEEYGYYFWWGDTVGYRQEGGAWVASDGSSQNFSFKGYYEFPNPWTEGKDNATLLNEGWITADGVLAPAHDAATAHLGYPWRMPTDAEFAALTNNCTTTWITTNGVSGRLVTGKGDYASRSIFLPAAGRGSGSSNWYTGERGYYWSSTPFSHNSVNVWEYDAWGLDFSSSDFSRNKENRCYGLSVRPLQEFVGYSAAGTVTFDPVTRTTPVPVPYAWLRACDPSLADESEAYEAAAHAAAANGRKTWACYALGLDPTDPLDDFRITAFRMEGDVPRLEFNRTTDGSGVSFLPYIKPLGKADLADAWRRVPEGGDPAFRFFAAEVVPPGVESVLGGVQLWAGGPYWAESNVGAEKPEDYGCHFWWGDTAGYVHTGSEWVSAKDGTGFSFDRNGAAAATCGKDDAALLSEGWIDATGSLAAAHDAAEASLCWPWRMPTDAEFEALAGNCDTEWITTNGVSGRLVTGRGAYADRSIFLPAAGFGYGSDLYNPGTFGSYWSSTPYPDNDAWSLYFFDSGDIGRNYTFRYYGRSVRPVRDAD